MLSRRIVIKLFLIIIGLLFSYKITPALPVSPPTDKKKPLIKKNGTTGFSSTSKSSVIRVHNPALPLSGNNQLRQKYLYEMVAQGLKKMTGQSSLKNAWLEILQDFKAGDSIAIKPNFNFIHLKNSNIITSPDLLNALVRQLIEIVGISPSDILVYDLCKKIPVPIKSQINKQIRYVERFDPDSALDKIKVRLRLDPAAGDPTAEISMRNSIIDKTGRSVKCYIPKALTQVQHLINVPLLTNHIFITNSGALKNHFGTVRFSNYSSYPTILHGDYLNESIADINTHPEIKEKTKLIIADGIKGVFDRGEGNGNKKWLTFDNDFPKSIFLSKDPVALDSVMAGHVKEERQTRNLQILSDNYLQTAAESGLGLNLLNDKMKSDAAPYTNFTI